MGENRFAAKYAAGAIRTSQEIVDLVIEARKEKKAIRLYCVGQMGQISAFYLTSKSRYVRNKRERDGSSSLIGPAYDEVTGFNDHAFGKHTGTNRRWHKSRILAGTYDLGGSSGFSPEHRLFTNRLLAERYGEALKADPEYVAGVKAHWARCRTMFSGWFA